MKHFAVISVVAALGLLAVVSILGSARAAGESAPADYSKISAPDLVAKTPKGKLQNPYKDSQKDIVAQGQTLSAVTPAAAATEATAAAACARP